MSAVLPSLYLFVPLFISPEMEVVRALPYSREVLVFCSSHGDDCVQRAAVHSCCVACFSREASSPAESKSQ